MIGFGVTPIEPGELLKLLEKQLSAAGTPTNSAGTPGAGLGSDAFLSLWPDQMHLDNPRSKRFVAIRPARFPIWQSIVQGAGTPTVGTPLINTTIGFNAVVTLACFVQINSDPEMRSAQAVSDAVLSITAFVMKVFAAVQFWTPRDDSGSTLLREPARILDGGFGFKQVQGKDGWWVPVALDLEMKFTAAFPSNA